LNIDSFLLVSPLYSKPGPIGQTEWFNLLMDSAQKPCMIYNIPSRTGVKIPIEVLGKIESHKNFWAVKEASGSIEEYQAFKAACPNVPLYSGDDGLTPFFARAGCSGLVSVSANVWPEATNLYVEKCLSGDTESMLATWSDAIKAMFMAPNPIPVKVLLKEKGVIETSCLRAPLTNREIRDTQRLLKVDELITNWYNQNKK
ncbi:MAG: dihydrodipicolinate synthase family protein, partial [Balneolaceae bacterium]